jgi:hypothetical protein
LPRSFLMSTRDWSTAMNSPKRTSTLSVIGAFLSVLLLAGIARGQSGDDTGDIRQTVARISFLSGNVSYVRGDDPDNWQAADFNVPVTIGDRLSTGDNGRAELQVHGGFTIRLGALADLAALNLTDDTKQWSLNTGYAAFEVRTLGENEVFEVDTPNAAITFERTGDYRVDVDADGNTRVTVRRGRAIVAAGGGQVPLNAGDQMNVDGIDSPRYDVVAVGSLDGFDRWVSERQRRTETSRSRQYVNEQIVGVADLDEHGRWQSLPSYGMAWTPTVIEADWQPYRAGHWIWQDPWGWTWVGAEPWGWAPYHYGRWVNSSSRWWWVPGARSLRVFYAPALVAFSGGGPGWSNGGGGFVGWFPLAPRDPFIHWWGTRRGGNVAPVTYVNRGFMTVVNHNTFVSGGIVTTNWVRDRSVISTVQRAPILRGPLPIMPTQASLRVAVRPGLPQAFRPAQAVVARAVVVRVQPPLPPPTFQSKVAVIQKNNGAPIAPAEAARLSQSDRGSTRAVVVTRPVSTDQGRVTFAPKSESSKQPRPEPVTFGRGRAPGPGTAPTPASPLPTPDRGRRPDYQRRDQPTQPPAPTQAPRTSAPTPDRGRRPDYQRRDQPTQPPAPTQAPRTSAPTPDRGRRPDYQRRDQPTQPPAPTQAPRTSAPTPDRGRRPDYQRRDQPTQPPAPTQAPKPPGPASDRGYPPNIQRRDQPTQPPAPTQAPNTSVAPDRGRRPDVAPRQEAKPAPTQPPSASAVPQRGRQPEPEKPKDKEKDKEKVKPTPKPTPS